MAKIKVQAQHLQPGDIVGSGERVTKLIANSTKIPSGKVYVELSKDFNDRSCYWGKYTQITVERAE